MSRRIQLRETTVVRLLLQASGVKMSDRGWRVISGGTYRRKPTYDAPVVVRRCLDEP